MAEYVFIGTEERVFDRLHSGVGSASRPAATGDLVHFPGVVTMAEALNVDLVPHDVQTRHAVELIREQVRIADARQFAPPVEHNADQTTAGTAELIARSEGRSKGRG